MTPAPRLGALGGPGDRRMEILQTLRALDPQARELPRERWAFSLLNGRPFDVAVSRLAGWLVIECRPEGASNGVPPERCWSLLELAAPFASGVKLLTDSRGLALRADLPVAGDQDDSGAPPGLLDAGHGLRAAWATLHGETQVPAEDSTRRIDVARLSSDAGWPGVERDGGRMAFELEAPGFWQALAHPAPDALELVVEVAALEDASVVVRAATAAYLLEVSGLIRLARGRLRGVAAAPVACFDVRLRPACEPHELRHALGALSVACRLWANEVRALQDESVASHWLQSRAGRARREDGNGRLDVGGDGHRPGDQRRVGAESVVGQGADA